jgi:hypothetical protein
MPIRYAFQALELLCAPKALRVVAVTASALLALTVGADAAYADAPPVPAPVAAPIETSSARTVIVECTENPPAPADAAAPAPAPPTPATADVSAPAAAPVPPTEVDAAPRKFVFLGPNSPASSAHTSYALHVMAADGLGSAAVLGLTALTKRGEPALLWLGTGAVVHAAHGNVLGAIGSVALRSAAAGATYGAMEGACSKSRERIFCDLGMGILVGLPLITVALVVDYTVLAGGAGQAGGMAKTTVPKNVYVANMRPTFSPGKTTTLGLAGDF